jgi:hypothetical protein
MIRIGLVFCLAAFLLMPLFHLEAKERLPYAARNKGYSGWTTTVSDGLLPVGMSGATLSVADSVVSALENPASLGLSFDGFAVQLSTNHIKNAHLQEFDQPIVMSNLGVGGAFYPWGAAVGFKTIYAEGQSYLLSKGNDSVTPEVSVQELHIALGRNFFNNKFSFGSALIIGRAKESLLIENKSLPDFKKEKQELNFSIGGIYQFPSRLLAGLSFVPAKTYSIEGGSERLVGFAQDLHTPFRLAAGAGWIPNRFFRSGLSFQIIGTDKNTTLIRSQSKYVGERLTLQPKLGLKYKAIDLRGFGVEIATGTYYEVPRIREEDNRIHVTWSVELQPWILFFGWGVDRSEKYTNQIFSGGINAGKLMRILDIIPKIKKTSPGGIFPNPFVLADSGLARPLVKNWSDHEVPGIVEVGLGIPKKIQNKVKRPDKSLKAIGKDLIETITSIPGEAVKELNLDPLKEKETQAAPNH